MGTPGIFAWTHGTTASDATHKHFRCTHAVPPCLRTATIIGQCCKWQAHSVYRISSQNLKPHGVRIHRHVGTCLPLHRPADLAGRDVIATANLDALLRCSMYLQSGLSESIHPSSSSFSLH